MNNLLLGRQGNSGWRFVVVALAWCAATVGAGAQTRPMELEDLFRLKRVADPQISPDGKRVAYVVTEVLKAENRSNADVWVMAADGSGEPRRLTASPKRDAHPRWSPDGKWIAFESARDGVSQIFLLPVDGGEAKKLTTISTGAGQAIWAPDGKSLAFVSAVFPEYSAKPYAEADKANKAKLDARESSKVKARVIDKLLYRHWDSWVDDLRQQIFVVKVKPDGTADGEPRNVTPGENDAVPTSSTFSAGDEFAWSPDGAEIVFSAPPLPIREQAWRTNHDVWSVKLATGERKNLTAANAAADGLPRFSPDGKTLAYRAQARAGFEADKWDLWLLDRASGQRRNLTAAWAGSVDNYVWSPDGQTIFLEGQEKGRAPLWSVSVAGGEVKRLFDDGVNHEISVSPDGRWLAFTGQRLTMPGTITRFRLGEKAPQPLALTNAAALAQVKFGAVDSVTVSGAGGTPVQMWIVKPPQFEAGKKYPLVFWVHGGPQSAFLDAWSTRWNAAALGGAGLRDRAAESAWLDGFWAEVYRRNLTRLGRESV
jgi:dipeptidyl aminopeptidase/acylaminoacyl peptidase